MLPSRQLAAIMFTDIVGYSAVMQHDEEKALRLMRRYTGVLHEEVTKHGGKILNDYGDSNLCIFNSAMEAVQAAIDIQAGLRQDPVVPLRIGLHIGEIFFEDGKIMGDGVNVASRIQSLAEANTILISSEIYSKIHNHAEFSTVFIGPFDFKNIDEPMQVYAIANKGLNVPKRENMTGKLKAPQSSMQPRKSWWAFGFVMLLAVSLGLYWLLSQKRMDGQQDANSQSVAVLYFDNLSGDSSQDYFSAGMTEEIISRLSNIPELRVKSRQSVMQYRGKSVPAKKIARELGVGNILQGSVRKQDSRVLITIQMIQGATEEARWSMTYNRELRDIFDVQAEIAQQVALRFNLHVTQGTIQKINTPPTRNIVAYDLFLKAIADSEMESGIGGTSYIRKAIGKLKQAIELDTMYADAYARLGIQYTFVAANERNPEIWLDSAMYYAQRAIQADPRREQGYISLARVNYLRGRQSESLRNLMKAEEIRPFSAIQPITEQLIGQHAFGEAWEWLEKARRHDPVDPAPHVTEIWIFLSLDMLDSAKARMDAASNNATLAAAMEQPILHYYLYTSNEQEYRKMSEKIYAGDEKQFAYAMGRYYLFRRSWSKADSFFRASARPDQMDAGLIGLNFGQTARGRDLLQKTVDARLQFMQYYHGWHAYDISRCYAALNDARFVTYFRKALEKGWFDYTWLKEDPFFDAVRESPYFDQLWRQVQADKAKYQQDLSNSMRKMKPV